MNHLINHQLMTVDKDFPYTGAYPELLRITCHYLEMKELLAP